jgi:hypothetical protein
VIGAEHEALRSGSQRGFFDCVAIELADPDNGVYGLLGIARRPAAATTSTLVLLFADGEVAVSHDARSSEPLDSWERAEAEGLTFRTVEPLERWEAHVFLPDARLEVDLRALSSPLDATEPSTEPVAAATGVSRYEQAVDVEGSVELGDRRALRGVGRRVHAWGEDALAEVETWCSLAATSRQGRALTVACARPPAGEGHDLETRAAHRLGAEAEPLAYAETRLSTVYGPDGVPRNVSLELFREGDEIPERAAGGAVCGAMLPFDGRTLVVSFMRWTTDVGEAFGGYFLCRRG